MIKVPHTIHIGDSIYRLSIKYYYDENENSYMWCISYTGIANDYGFKSKNLNTVQYQVLDWIRKGHIEYE